MFDTNKNEAERNQTKHTQNWRELRKTKFEITYSIKDSKCRQVLKEHKMFEWCQHLFRQQPKQRKRERLNHSTILKDEQRERTFKSGLWQTRESSIIKKERHSEEHDKETQNHSTFVNPRWWKLLNNEAIWNLCEMKIREMKGRMNWGI